MKDVDTCVGMRRKGIRLIFRNALEGERRRVGARRRRLEFRGEFSFLVNVCGAGVESG